MQTHMEAGIIQVPYNAQNFTISRLLQSLSFTYLLQVIQSSIRMRCILCVYGRNFWPDESSNIQIHHFLTIRCVISLDPSVNGDGACKMNRNWRIDMPTTESNTTVKENYVVKPNASKERVFTLGVPKDWKVSELLGAAILLHSLPSRRLRILRSLIINHNMFFSSFFILLLIVYEKQTIYHQ